MKSTLLTYSRLRCWLLALAAAVLLVLPLDARAAPPTTVAVGDDHLSSARGEILGQFSNAGWPSSVIVPPDNRYRIHEMRPYLQYVAAFTPGLKRVFLYAGRDDAFRYSLGRSGALPPWDIKTSLGHLSGAVQDVRRRKPLACIFLTTVFQAAPEADRDYHYAATRLNNHMFDLEDKYPGVFVIDWNAFQRGKGWLAADYPYLHPVNYYLTESGQDALADLYRFFGSLPAGCGTRPQPV